MNLAKLNEKIETLEAWKEEAECVEICGINFIEREIIALIYSYKDQVLQLEE